LAGEKEKALTAVSSKGDADIIVCKMWKKIGTKWCEWK
jgi:hypothetical protein